jgi:hypothetical protein
VRAVEIAHFVAALTAASLAAGTVVGVTREASPRTLAVMVAAGVAETVIAAALALRASQDEQPSKALLVPGALLTSLAFVFFLGVLVLGGL